MDFCSILFLCFFFPLFYLVYYLLPKKHQNKWLCFSSMLFLICGRDLFIWYFILTCFSTYCFMRILKHLPKNLSKKKMMIWFTCFEILIWYLFIRNFRTANGMIYPICYSIMLLQNLVSLFDFYYNQKRIPSLFHYITYTSCFSKLVFGPIISYFEMEQELKKREISKAMIIDGSFLFLKGVFQNVLLVNGLSLLRENLLSISSSILSNWFILFITMLQIILWFMSYSNMSIGLSKMLGFSWKLDFEYPLCLKRMNHFFENWHVSILNCWNHYILKLKYPFFMKIILLLFFLSITYGIGWNLLLFFWMIGFWIVIEEYVLKKVKWSDFIRYVIHFIWMLLSFICLVRPSISGIGETIIGLFDILNLPFFTVEMGYYFYSYFIIVLISIVACIPFLKPIWSKIEKKVWYHIGRNLLYMLLIGITLVLLISNTHSSIWGFRI